MSPLPSAAPAQSDLAPLPSAAIILQDLTLKKTEAFKMYHEGRASGCAIVLLPQFAGIWNSNVAFDYQYKKWMSLQVLILSLL